MSALSGASRAALAAGALLALVDLCQVALVYPASLSAATVAWLVGLYLAVALAGGLFVAAMGAVLGQGRERAAALAAFVVAGTGAAVLLSEAGLRQVQPLSPVRPWIVLGACVAGLAIGLAARRVARVPTLVVAALVAAFVAGGVGATRGFVVPRAAAPAGDHLEAARGPNVLVVLIDTLRADHLGCYGYERPTSPAIDAFARESVQFMRAYSQSTWTKPATASLFTGRYPRQHQAYLRSEE